ncbi:pyridoxamine 5'-phosphate oxidase family protein [Methanobacterium aggregans]|uniref:pyridoxamine 5'-phosphate oxidase family protein n=1 Tax=Methanobacterium aggregans TaxID=1615586 RepID=UPI001AE1AB18|nr:pyridoxamine 5'-phosphate oxidase family protein [Methanobacterium aggregans]MBP2046222.1 nitroimidazol reductase NimA-like FMN-containing flavoprotein (pyridoxamine 5'-phosphate oxidase superfamily) [Methanobacterium aggregans]
MKLEKIPLMNKREYDELINECYVSRIAFKGEYPYIAPFIYVFDGDFIYFLSTRYGKKIELFRENPNVAVEIEKYSENLSDYRFVTLQGRVVEVNDPDKKKRVKEDFVQLIKDKNLSKSIMAALGHSPDDPLESIVEEDRSFVWKLADVKGITGIKSS